MKQNKIILPLLFFIQFSLFGQNYSLIQCLEYAKQKNSNMIIADLDLKLSREKITEQIGTALPQINFTGTLDDKLQMATTIMPGELVGKPGTTLAIQMGTKYNTTAGFTLNQKIFSPSFWVALKAAKISEDISQLNVQKNTEQVQYNVCFAYYVSQVAQKQLNNLKKILEASKQTLVSTQLKFKNGIGKKIDVDKVQVSYNNTYSQLQQTELKYKQTLTNLKFAIGMPVESEISLSDSLRDPVDYSTVDSNANYRNFVSNRIEYQLQKTMVALYEADKENNISAYLPTLSFYANYNYLSMRNQFDAFHKNSEWYANSAIGLELKIPIFSGFSRYSKVEQSVLTVQKEKENLHLEEQSIYVDISNKSDEYTNSLSNIRMERDNLELAESVYKNTQIDFSQGAASSLDLTQAERSLVEAQNNYYTRLQSLYIAKLDLEKSQGTLHNYIHNLK